MDRKMNRRGGRHDHVLSKTMIGSPTNFVHVGHSYLPQDRFDDCELAEEATANLNEYLTEVSPEEQQEGGGEGEEAENEEEEEEEGSEDDGLPLPPSSSPSSAGRNSRRISKDMISLPTNFRHLLHIDPSSADPEQLSQLLKASNDPEYDSHNGQQHQHDHDDPTWHPQEPNREPQLPPITLKPARPSLRVRKSMIGPPTNFQHVNHISAGERLSAPESPPPQLPSEPADGEGGRAGGHETIWKYHKETTAPSTPPTTHYTTESTYDRPTSPPIRVPTTYTTSSTTSTSSASYTPLRSPHSTPPTTSTPSASYTPLRSPHSTPPTTYISSTSPCRSSSSIHTSSTSTSYSTASTPSTTVSSRYTNTNTHYTRASSYYSTSSTPIAPSISSPIPYITQAPAKPKPTPPPLPHFLPPPGITTASAPRSAPPHRDTTRKSLPMSSGGADLDFDFHQFRVPPPPRQNGGL